MAGENVVASGAIAVNLTLNDPQGAFTGGAIPGAPGAGAVPSGARRGEYAGYLSPEQREGLKGARKEQEYLKELADYNKLVKGDLPEDKASKFAIKKFLPMLGGVLGIAAIAQHSMIISQSIGALSKILGALVDVILMPFMPLIAAALTTLADIVAGVAQFMKDPKEFVQAVWGRIQGFGETTWNAIKDFALDRWEIIKNGVMFVWTLLPEKVQTFIKDIASAIGSGAEAAWIWIKEKFEKYFPWLKDQGQTAGGIYGTTQEKFGLIQDFFNSPGFKAFMIGAAGGGAVGGAAGLLGGPAAPVTVPLLGVLGSILGGLIGLATQQELSSRRERTVTNNVSINIGAGLSTEEEARRLYKLMNDNPDERYP